MEAGHEGEGISRNADNETPLMIACESKQIEVGKLLIQKFPNCIPEQNKSGMDAVSLSTYLPISQGTDENIAHARFPSRSITSSPAASVG
jgi:hypothetical protein